MTDEEKELQAFLAPQAPHEEAAAKIKAHFAAAPGPAEIVEGEHRELTEELLAEYHGLAEKLKAMEELKESLRKRILSLMGRDAEALRGAFACFVETRKRTTTDWRAFCEGQFGKDGYGDLIAPYTRESESQTLQVRKIGH